MVACAISASAQEAGKSVKQFEGKMLFLRHPLHDESQVYDQNGAVLKRGPEESWTVCGGILIDHVNLMPDKLLVEGRRIFFLFPKQRLTLFEFKRLKGRGSPPLSPSVTLEIQLKHPIDSEGQALKVLKRVFALHTSEVIKSLPDFWRIYLTTHHFQYDAVQPKEAEFRWQEQPERNENAVRNVQSGEMSDVVGEEPAVHIGPDVKAPRPKSIPGPGGSSKIAQYEKYKGVVVLNMIVGTDGAVHRVRLLQPMGLGLDEIAQSGVHTWRFKPSTHKGNPVAVEMNIEIGFDSSGQ